jgi:hypothetical protein
MHKEDKGCTHEFESQKIAWRYPNRLHRLEDTKTHAEMALRLDISLAHLLG